jgi:hypothetical protein
MVSLSFGCALYPMLLDVGKDACDSALEGSKASALCDKIEELKAEAEADLAAKEAESE